MRRSMKPSDERVQTRRRRVMVLLAGVVVLSLADLVITLTHLKTTGMMEANPIAAFLIQSTQSGVALTCFKLLTVGICVALLFVLRHRFEGELAAWCAVAILAGMSLQWHVYSSHFQNPAEVMVAQAGGYGDGWLMIE